jgi:hypothetical protein
MLSRRWNGVSKKKNIIYNNQRLFTTAQLKTLIQYINDFTEYSFPLINSIIQNFAATIIK